MALSADDRLLGEKVDNYCSSSEDEGDSSEEGSEGRSSKPTDPNIEPPPTETFDGHSANTGPKGVLNDWRRFKQLETEKRTEQDREKIQLAKKLTLTCRSHLDDEKEKAKDDEFMESIMKELEVFEDGFLQEYRLKRIEELRKAYENMPKFGEIIPLNKLNFIEAIDGENSAVTIIIHIYEEDITACEAMNGCLLCLAQEYPTVKFCKVKATETELSARFAEEGVPALLIYKNKELIGNFVRLVDRFGEDFFFADVESFLLEHGMIPDKSLVMTSTIRTTQEPSDNDSDFDLD